MPQCHERVLDILFRLQERKEDNTKVNENAREGSENESTTLTDR